MSVFEPCDEGTPLFYLIAETVNDFSDYLVLLLLIFPGFSRRPQNATCPPSAAKAMAAARPIPDVAPVMSTTLFSNRRRGFTRAVAGLSSALRVQPATVPVIAAAVIASIVRRSRIAFCFNVIVNSR
jgi:hypothetical protein